MSQDKDNRAANARIKIEAEEESCKPMTPRRRTAEKGRRRVVTAERHSPANATTSSTSSRTGKNIESPIESLPARANHEANSRKAILPKDGGYASVDSPITIIGAASGDPFESFPLPSEPHVRELLSLYVDSSLFTTDSGQGNASGIHTELTSRRLRWFPLAIQSPAGYAAMIAYLETAHGNPRNADDDAYRRQYLGVGLEHLKTALRNPESLASDSTCFAVVLFLMTALQLNDFDAVQSHVLGLATIVQRRKQLSLGKEGSYQQPSRLKEARKYETTAFPYLHEQGLLSKRMAEILHHNHLLGEYIFLFQQDAIAGKGSAQHVWKPEDFPADMTCFEQACLSTFRVWVQRIALKNPPTMPRQTMMQNLYRALQGVDAEDLWIVCPSALLWMALVAGPVAEDQLAEYFTSLLRQTQAKMFLWSFQAAVQLVAEEYFWDESLNSTTEKFWDSVINSSSLVEHHESEAVPDAVFQDGLSVDERPLTLQPKIALQGPRNATG